MKLSSNPFSLYDFLGYFLTGFLCLYLLKAGFDNSIFDFFDLKRCFIIFHKSKPSEMDYIFIIIVSYLTGHLISFLSSISVERYNIHLYGYPSKYLLDLKPSEPSLKNYLSEVGTWRHGIMRIVIFILLLPIISLDAITNRVFKLRTFFTRPYSKELISLITKKIEKIYNEVIFEKKDHDGEKYDLSEFFSPIYHFIMQDSEKHYIRTQNFVALYGLMRNLTLLFVGISWLTIFSAIYNWEYKHLPIAFSSIIVSFVFFLAYLKFFRKFTEEVLLGAFSLKATKSEEND
jgi:hypothetical protein